MPERIIDTIQTEGGEHTTICNLLIPLAKLYLSETAIVKQKEWDVMDVLLARGFLITAAPYSNDKLFPTYWEHILLASIYGKKIAEKVDCPVYPPQQAEVTNLLHDCGRLVVPNRYYRNDLVANLIFDEIDASPESLDTLPPLERIIGIKSPINSVDDLTVPQIINHVADNMGKRNKQGELVTLADIQKFNSGGTYLGVWPSEKRALYYLRQPGTEEHANRLVCDEVAWLQEEYDIDFDALKPEVEDELRLPENQNWLSLTSRRSSL